MLKRAFTCYVAALCFFLGLHAQTVVCVARAGELSSVLFAEQLDTCTSLTIQGKLNSADIKVLRRMAGCGTDGRMGQLSVLDLREAKFVNDKEPFMSLDAAECMLAGTAIPDRYIENSSSASSALRNGNDRGIFLYKPKFLLGYSRDEAVTERTVPSVEYDRESYAPLMVDKESDGDYRFALGITDAQWREMEEYGVTSFKGHRIVRENGRFIFRSYLVKSTFLADMFYGCTSLRVLVLPRKMKMDFSVMDETAHYRIVRMNR